MRLEGKTAVVTGAGSGMGRAISILFAKEGANVVIADINAEAVEEVVEEIETNGGQAVSTVTNVAEQEDINNMIKTAVDTYGSLDILVNNAGVLDNFITAGNVTDELWDRVIGINLTGAFKAARAAINVMEEQENGGVIINNASVGGLFGAQGGAAYTTSKHGLVGLTKNIASTYGIYGKIRANAIAPGGVKTNIFNSIVEPDEIGYKAVMDSGSVEAADAEQIAEVALFLASDSSSYVNGAVIVADGGATVR